MMRKLNFSNYTVAFAMLLLVGCGADRREKGVNADTAAIEAVSVKMVEAYKARDWDTFSSYFTDDGIWMPPGEAPLHGKDAWWEWAQPWWDELTVVQINVTSEEIVVIDDWAFERHIETQVTTFGADGEPEESHFKGVWILRQQEDGAWKISRYIWNENAPPN